MSANITDKITDVRNSARPVTASVNGTRNAGGASLSCDALTGWPTASKVHFVTYRVDSNSNPVAGTQLDCYGIVSGNAINSFTVIDGNDVGHAVGDKVEMLPTAAWGQDLADALTNQHSRLGAHVGVNNTGGMTNAGGLTTDTLTVTSGSTLPAGDIGTADIAASAVTTAKIADSAVTPVKMLGIDMYGVTAAHVGSVPAAGSGQFYIQSGSSVVSFSAFSATITFPVAFPNGTLSVIVNWGDNTVTSNTIVPVHSSISASSFQVNTGSSTGSGRVDWVAIGF